MSKIRVLEVRNFDTLKFIRLSRDTTTQCADLEQLVMLSCKGLYFLVPYEILQDNAARFYKKIDGSFNPSLPPEIGLHQCIPIPSETAKILMEL